MANIASALAHFIDQATALAPGGLFTAPFDPLWRSACEVREAEGTTFWQPTPQTAPLDFSGLANAVEAPIHPDIQAYYGGYWSGTLQGRSREGPVSLIQLWNADDFQRLLENLVGHLFTKRRSKQAFTAFFANTDPDSELFLSIDNLTGTVWLEEPGKPPLREVAANLGMFLERLEPDSTRPTIY